MGKKGIEEIMESMEVFISESRFQPLSQTKIVVNRNELIEYLDEIKNRLPVEIERCKKIMRNKEAILVDARTRSDAIVSDAVNEANRMVDQHQITQAANSRAGEIIDSARRKAQEIIDNANEEATDIRLGAMYYTKDKLAEMREIFIRISEVEKENYTTLIQSLESDTHEIEANINEMDATIGLATASSNMSYQEEADNVPYLEDEYVTPIQAPTLDQSYSDYDELSDSAFGSSEEEVYNERKVRDRYDRFKDDDDDYDDDDLLED